MTNSIHKFARLSLAAIAFLGMYTTAFAWNWQYMDCVNPAATRNYYGGTEDWQYALPTLIDNTWSPTVFRNSGTLDFKSDSIWFVYPFYINVDGRDHLVPMYNQNPLRFPRDKFTVTIDGKVKTINDGKSYCALLSRLCTLDSFNVGGKAYQYVVAGSIGAFSRGYPISVYQGDGNDLYTCPDPEIAKSKLTGTGPNTTYEISCNDPVRFPPTTMKVAEINGETYFVTGSGSSSVSYFFSHRDVGYQEFERARVDEYVGRRYCSGAAGIDPNDTNPPM